jgi:hypothetical protein
MKSIKQLLRLIDKNVCLLVAQPLLLRNAAKCRPFSNQILFRCAVMWRRRLNSGLIRV